VGVHEAIEPADMPLPVGRPDRDSIQIEPPVGDPQPIRANVLPCSLGDCQRRPYDHSRCRQSKSRVDTVGNLRELFYF